MRNLGLFVFGNQSGIGYQTKRLAEFLTPERILYIDSASFSKNTKQHFEWYENLRGYKVKNFPPMDHELRVFLKDLTHVFLVENPFNYDLLSMTKAAGIKTYIQSNYEFCDHLDKNIELPTKFLMPSYWKVKEMKEKFGEKRVDYLPPPIDPNEFKNAREKNFNRKGGRRFLHITGTMAVHDRNGLLSVLEAMQYVTEDFELVIKSQYQLEDIYMIDHPNVKYLISNNEEPEELYSDFDALILPRRYGGLCLPLCEGLMSALPCIMTDIEPNNSLLPEDWLIPSSKIGEFYTRTNIEIYNADAKQLANKLNYLNSISDTELEKMKLGAFEIGYTNFAWSKLREQYDSLWI